jgi:cytochrome P450
MSSWTAHRNPTHFPEPDSFQPSRWISEKSDSSLANGEGDGGTDAMKKLYMPFSRGMYRCVGQAMALLSLRIIVATLVLKYDFKLAENAKITDMDWDDHFLIIPKGKCNLIITPL